MYKYSYKYKYECNYISMYVYKYKCNYVFSSDKSPLRLLVNKNSSKTLSAF